MFYSGSCAGCRELKAQVAFLEAFSQPSVHHLRAFSSGMEVSQTPRRLAFLGHLLLSCFLCAQFFKTLIHVEMPVEEHNSRGTSTQTRETCAGTLPGSVQPKVAAKQPCQTSSKACRFSQSHASFALVRTFARFARFQWTWHCYLHGWCGAA